MSHFCHTALKMPPSAVLMTARSSAFGVQVAGPVDGDGVTQPRAAQAVRDAELLQQRVDAAPRVVQPDRGQGRGGAQPAELVRVALGVERLAELVTCDVAAVDVAR